MSSSVSELPDAQSALGAQIKILLECFTPVTLDDLQGAALFNRVDTKFLMTEQHLLQVLEKIQDFYCILMVEGYLIGQYTTTYFDSPQLEMYLDHHNGLRDRYKVRIRRYEHNATSFLEIKRKSNKERTQKMRIRTEVASLLECKEVARFIIANTPYEPGALFPSLWNRFGRISLVNRDGTERLTLDIDLRCGWNGHVHAFPGLVIAEVKQPKFSLRSPFVQEIHRLHLSPTGFSKYCVGVASLHSGVKQNQFKELLAYIRRLSERRPSP